MWNIATVGETSPCCIVTLYNYVSQYVNETYMFNFRKEIKLIRSYDTGALTLDL